MSAADLLARFESIGDNCEFGFVQAAAGLNPGGLLRWAIAAPEPLIAALDARFAGLYRDENLIPTSDDMLRDELFGLYFHTRMRSHLVEGVRVYAADEPTRTALHEQETLKIRYLAEKLLDQLVNASVIFVYKRNAGMSDALKRKLYRRLTGFNPRNRLLIAEAGADAGKVVRLEGGLFVGTIDRLAPYDKADDVSSQCWQTLCQSTVDMH